MTEHGGAYARWSAAALLAPAAAAVFVGATTWSQRHVAAVSAPAPAPQVAASPDPRLVRLRTTVAAERAALARLEQAVQQLRLQAAHSRVAPAGTRRQPAVTAGRGTAALPPLPAPAPLAAAPAPPPPVQAVTGASGAVR